MDQFGSSQKLVIVEDNVSLAEIYSIRLQALGYTTAIAHDGITALQTIQQVMPDLVLLDLMVPKIAGDEILARMRASDWGKNIKVLIISNLNESDAPAGLRDLGIEGYAVKANLSNDQLDQLVDAILKPATQTEDVNLDQGDRVSPDNFADADIIQRSSSIVPNQPLEPIDGQQSTQYNPPAAAEPGSSSPINPVEPNEFPGSSSLQQ